MKDHNEYFHSFNFHAFSSSQKKKKTKKTSQITNRRTLHFCLINVKFYILKLDYCGETLLSCYEIIRNECQKNAKK